VQRDVQVMRKRKEQRAVAATGSLFGACSPRLLAALARAGADQEYGEDTQRNPFLGANDPFVNNANRLIALEAATGKRVFSIGW
jgi:hypothetical protein